MSNKKPNTGCSRREFVAGAAAAAATISIVAPKTVRAYEANSKINLGVIGCGGRGTFLGKLFAAHGGYNIAAVADYFPDRVESAGEKLGVVAEHRYSGLNGYRRMLDGKVDAVAIESPPWFHPEQTAAAIDAGKHVYLAKPIAVDVPGCQSIDESGQKATAKKLCLLVDFQTRADPFYKEALKRVHEGAIGKFAFGESTYHGHINWGPKVDAIKQGGAENRILAWALDRVLSGDTITEQFIHTLDVAAWVIGKPPVAAFGTGGQKCRDYGDCWDTFSVTFQFPDNIGVAFSARQFDAFGTQPDGIRNRMFGDQGVLETAYGGDVLIRGKNFWRGGKSPGIYKDGAVANIATFHDLVASGDCTNTTVPDSVRSNLVSILGRTAAYKGERVTWEELMKSTERLEFDTRGLVG